MPDARSAYKISVYGRVQGVGFRRSCLREARFRGLSGFVRNMPDGSVFVHAEGNRDQLDELVKWCRQGPGFGSVEYVAVETGTPEGHASFDVRYD